MPAALTLSCRRQERRGVDTVAVLPVENLTGDASLAWTGAAIQGIVRTETSASLDVRTLAAGDSNDATAAGAARVLRAYLTSENGKLRLAAVVRDAKSNRDVQSIATSGDPAAGVLPLAETLAKAISDRTRPFGTKSPAAIRAWGEGLAGNTYDARYAALERAIAADPNFGEAYLALAEAHFVAGDRGGAMQALDRARSRENLFTDFDRARVDLSVGEMSGNAEERRRALVALSRLNTTDTRTLQQLGDLEYNARRFQQASDAFRSAIALDPDNPTLLNMLGYSEALRGNLDGALEALERYRRATNDGGNAYDSIGDAYFLNGQFADAERNYLQANEKSPAGGAELLKAAQARLITGDTSGADGIFSRYVAARRQARDPLIAVEGARWLYIEGKRKQALGALESAANSAQAPDVSAYAHAQAALWYVAAGQPGPAQDHAAKAMELAQGAPGVRPVAVLARFIAQPKTDAQAWMMGAEQVFGPGMSPLKMTAAAYGLLLAKQYGPASEIFNQMYRSTPPSADGQPRTMYALTLVETSRKVDAAPLVELYPLFLGQGEPLFSTLTFPRFLYVRAKVMEAVGRQSDADKCYAALDKFKPDLPDALPSGR